MNNHVTFLFVSGWAPGDWFKEITGLDKLEEIYSKMSSWEKSIIAYLEKIKITSENVGSQIEDIKSRITSHLPKLTDLDTKLGSMKTTLANTKTTIDNMLTGLTEAKNKLVNIESYSKNLPDISTELTSATSKLESLKTFMSDIKTSITSYLPKLGKLDTLDTINTKLEDLKSTISTLDITIPEGLEVNLDDSKIIEELRKNTQTIQNLSNNFGDLGNKLGILENINDNLINQITLQQYGINLLSSNIPMAQEFFNLTTRMNKINDLGFKILSFKVTPMEYIDQFNKIMEQTYSLSIPAMPDIFISRPTEIVTGGPTPVIPEETEPVRPGDVDIISGDILGPGGIPGESILSGDFIDTDRIQEVDTSLGELSQPIETGETPGTGTIITPGSLPEGGTIGAYIDDQGNIIIVGGR